jgi:hypothetical protein
MIVPDAGQWVCRPPQFFRYVMSSVWDKKHRIMGTICYIYISFQMGGQQSIGNARLAQTQLSEFRTGIMVGCRSF